MEVRLQLNYDDMGKIKVLLIEDEITLAKIIKDTLESIGFDVCLAYDGEEGLKLFFESKPDVLISDIMMPKISGLDVVQCGTENTKNRPDYTCNLSDGKNRGG